MPWTSDYAMEPTIEQNINKPPAISSFILSDYMRSDFADCYVCYKSMRSGTHSRIASRIVSFVFV